MQKQIIKQQLEDQKQAMQKEMALRVAKLMQEQTMVQEEMRKKIQESAQAASDAAFAQTINSQ